MAAQTSKGKLYSLRLFNEVFGDRYNISLLKDNHNKDIVSNSPMDLLGKLQDITERTIIQKELMEFLAKLLKNIPAHYQW